MSPSFAQVLREQIDFGTADNQSHGPLFRGNYCGQHINTIYLLMW